jgi:dTDP-4-dehydrorhamnose reductase
VKKRVLILGGTGMLGHMLFRQLSAIQELEVFGTVRSLHGVRHYFSEDERMRLRENVDADNFDTIIRALAAFRPEIVINCIGLIKQLPIAGDPLSAITINSELPHRISMVCRAAGARMIHISTDCVFDGKKGSYTEADIPNATDLYGRTKFLGEVVYPPHCLTLRTSIIGHEIKGRHSLVEWFLGQSGKTNGYTRAIFSGLTTLEIARVIANHVIPNPGLTGLYHLSAAPISKYDLLHLMAKSYGKAIEIVPATNVVIDRSLDSTQFQEATGYRPPSWPELVDAMARDYRDSKFYQNQGKQQ